jgi:hypothetical protein
MIEQVGESKGSVARCVAPDVARVIRDAFGDALVEDVSVLDGGAGRAVPRLTERHWG